jgi:transcription initiation factor TFIID subunit TAF12
VFCVSVWNKLEQSNKEFFEAYNIRVRIRQQIEAFDYLMKQQAHIVEQYLSESQDEEQPQQQQQQQQQQQPSPSLPPQGPPSLFFLIFFSLRQFDHLISENVY